MERLGLGKPSRWRSAITRGHRLWWLLCAIVGAMLLVAFAINSLAPRMRRAFAQRDAVRAIRELGGVALYDLRLDDNRKEEPDPEPTTFPILRRVLGDDFFDTVVFCELTTDEQLEHARALPGLRRLRLWRRPPEFHAIYMCDEPPTRVTDAGLGSVKCLVELRELDGTATRTTDGGLRCLRGLGHLGVLCLDSTPITDAGLEHLTGLGELEALSLNWTAISNAGVKEISRLATLRKLEIGNTRIGDAGLENLTGLTRLEELAIPHTQVTPQGLASLSSLPNLRRLSLSDLTEAKWEQVGHMDVLEELSVFHSEVSAFGVGRLRNLARFRVLSLIGKATGLEYLQAAFNVQTVQLTGVEVTDKEVADLGKLSQLVELDLRRAYVSSDAIETLRGLLPTCRVVGEGY